MPDLKQQLVELLEQIPGIEHRIWPDRDDGFSTIDFNGKEIAHFHSRSEIDVRLGSSLIAEENLTHPESSQVHPKRSKNSQYLEMGFSCRSDVEEICRLVRLLISRR